MSACREASHVDGQRIGEGQRARWAPKERKATYGYDSRTQDGPPSSNRLLSFSCAVRILMSWRWPVTLLNWLRSCRCL